ncbi:MAG: M20/M25/M40 family metallo-hydrolase [Acidobacteria bacterium]|nr:M20/M25/M40 family metallo-hydrolase [Acidobacteriota bacterium]
MRLIRSALVFGLVLGASVSAEPTITGDELLGHIRFLSSDELEGRGNGSPGLERAADYIAARFEAAGLRPGGPDGGWFQPFELSAGLTIGDGNRLVVRSGATSISLSLGDAYYPLAVSPTEEPSQRRTDLMDVPLVFAGYGVSAPEFGYDDYEGLDVTGKAVLIFSHEPQENQRESRLNGNRPLRATTLQRKAREASSRGAVALLVVSDPSHRVDQANYEQFEIVPDAEDHQIPVLRIARAQMAPVLRAWGLDDVANQVDLDLVPRSHPLPGATIDYIQRLSTNRRTVRNVVGILDGTDPARAQQAVVLGAHYDHVGLGGRFSNAPDRTGEIHNGADDNASGIAALIEIARSAANDRDRFPRSLVFVAFAGEERGLLGSRHYVSAPALPLADTVAMLNLDMIGRSRGDVEIGGLDSVPAIREDIDAAAEVAEVTIRAGGPGAGRSDDASFGDRRIPALHFFTGFHDDYHRPSDDWDRIDPAGTARVATLAFEVAARIAARRDRPAFGAREEP